MPKFNLDELNKLYSKGKSCDDKLFSEQRTNILLRTGDHYSKKKSNSFNDARTRGVKNLDQKIRLVKNHIHRITNIFINSILEGNPSVTAIPYNEQELSDVKSSQTGNSIISWVKDSNNWSKKQSKFVNDFVVVGECWGKIRFDYSKGPVVGLTEEGENIRAGEFVIDRIFAFDLKRDPNARDMDECKWWIHEQMIDIDEFKDIVAANSPENLPKVTSSKRTLFKIFDANTGEYKDSKNNALVKELYYKPDSKYPNGYYVMFTDDFIVSEMPLPFGIFPLVGEGFDEQTTNPRASSIIRVCRPYQIEINRASSKMAEHQITLGDDKVFIQKGTKISSGGYLNGVRAIQFSGQAPIIQPGRPGTQFLEYQLAQVREMYEACGLAMQTENKAPQSGDPYQLLFRSMKDKKRFVKYVEKYERFEISIFKKILDMSKRYLTEDHHIRVQGRSEAVNIPEFKRMDQDGFQIKVIPQSGDIETKFGKILSLSQVIQYAGSSLEPDQLGQLIRELPFGNQEQLFSSLTVDHDNAVNDILAMDRGEAVSVNPNDNHTFMIKALVHRMKKSDYKFLPDEVKELYRTKLMQHEQVLVDQQQQAQQASMGMVPTGGFLVTVNASMFNPAANRVERIKVPSEAVDWLVQKLSQQGAYMAQMAQLPASVQSDVAAQGAEANLPMIEPQPQAEQTLGAESPI